MRLRFLLSAAGVLAFSASVPAQTLIVGRLATGSAPTHSRFVETPTTLVSTAQTATANGTVDFAALTGGPDGGCLTLSADVKIKFFRPGPGVLHFLGERGPLRITSNYPSVPVEPPFPVQAGDVVGISLVAGCWVFDTEESANGFLLSEPGDVMTDISIGFVFPPSGSLSLQASNAGNLPLLGGRFRATLFAHQFAAQQQIFSFGHPVPTSGRSGYFSLPALTGDAAFPEVSLKMADLTQAPPEFGQTFWLFQAPLTSVPYELSVHDMTNGLVRVYQNLSSIDTSAFKP